MTRYPTPYEYGTMTVYQALVSFAVAFVGVSLRQNVTRSCFRVEREELARIMGSIVAVPVGSATLVRLAISVYLPIRPMFFGIRAGGSTPCPWWPA